VARAHRTAKDILNKHRGKLEEIAQRLMREETLDEDTFNSMFDVPASPSPEPPADQAPRPAQAQVA
jgi:ATP-dependent Zn protease